MRRARIIALVGMFAALPGIPASVASGHVAASRCAAGHSPLVAADTTAEVYLTRLPEPIYHGCAYGSTHTFSLGFPATGSSGGSAGTRRVTLVGDLVSYQTESVAERPVREEAFYIVVRSLRTGRVVRRVPDGVPLEPSPQHIGVGVVQAMVLKSDGAISWIARDDGRSLSFERTFGNEVSHYDLYTLDSTGEHLLASGTELDPSSLALTGSTLYWSQGGTPHTSTLH